MKRIILFFIFSLLICGCLKKNYWDHPTKTENQFYTDTSNCELKSYQTYPQRYSKDHCREGNDDGWDEYVESFCFEIDKNANPRNRYLNRCMKGLGYTIQENGRFGRDPDEENN